MVPDAWVFTGSFFTVHEGKQIYAGDHTDAVVSIVPAPAAVVRFAAPVGNPYEGEDFGLEVGDTAAGEIGDEVTLVFSPYSRE